MAATLCLEMGLHRRALLEAKFPDLEERCAVLRTFWSVYILERKVCLTQEIPFMIQDAHVDRSMCAPIGQIRLHRHRGCHFISKITQM